MRLAVPDFAAVAQRYQETGELPELIGLLSGGQRNEYDFHKMVFDEKLLHERLMQAGFTSVKRFDWRHSEHAWLDDYSQAYLPHMDKEKGQLMSLNLEAVK